MEEKWIETKIWFKEKILEKDDKYSHLLETFNRIINENEGKILGFHFFFEPNPDMLFRIELNGSITHEEMESFIREKLTALDFVEKLEFNREYIGEVFSFGEDGWKIAKKFFEISSKFAISQVDTNFKKEKEYTDEKLIHCFCNQVHISYPKEIEFYIRRLQNLGVRIEKKE